MSIRRYTYNIFRCLTLVLCLCSLGMAELQARHIIGGDMTYVCNGNGTYTITLKVYRDCNSGGANYDNPGFFGVFNGSQLLQQLSASPSSITSIPPDDNPCVTLTNPPCVESATYTLANVNLPQSNQSYTIAYQRCCRNETINNIVNPQDAGATFFVEITPDAQQVCNDSPVFDDFPPIVICAGQFLNFDHGATDPEGDSLTYSFCAPLLGGGIFGTSDNPGNPNGPNGVQPIPPSGPPYNTVTFLAPTYTPNSPMAGAPTISINPQTGVITGVPQALGQFVVGVCVEEYRNGELIGQIQRDFQFNVINCQPEVFADIQEDTIINAQEYIINLCGDTSHFFINESLVNTPEREFYWEFIISEDSIFTATTEDVFVAFPDTGTYFGTLIVNPGFVCNDTADIIINVLPDLSADFSFVYDTCLAAPVEFTNLSTSGAGAFSQFIWNFGDGNTSGTQDSIFNYEYTIPGNFNVGLIARDINNCLDTTNQPLNYFPAPNDLVVDLDNFLGCAPETVFFDNLSFPIDTTYSILWNFGDGNTSNEISPSHEYTNAGIYEVSLDVTSPIGCEVEVPFNATLELLPSPTAGFVFDPESATNFAPEINFTDQSQDAIAWYWDFGDGSPPVLVQNPVHTFGTGEFNVMQVVRHESGCRDTAFANILGDLLVTYYLPNAFTPNGDGKNEEFKGTGFFEGMTNFEMSIWNRWGERLFLTNDPEQAWNGRKDNEGPLVQNGVYVVVVRYVDPDRQTQEIKGFVTLLR